MFKQLMPAIRVSNCFYLFKPVTVAYFKPFKKLQYFAICARGKIVLKLYEHIISGFNLGVLSVFMYKKPQASGKIYCTPGLLLKGKAADRIIQCSCRIFLPYN